MSDRIMQIVDKMCAQAIRPKGYSQSHARKIWRESTSEHARKAMVYGWSQIRYEPGRFPSTVEAAPK